MNAEQFAPIRRAAVFALELAGLLGLHCGDGATARTGCIDARIGDADDLVPSSVSARRPGNSELTRKGSLEISAAAACIAGLLCSAGLGTCRFRIKATAAWEARSQPVGAIGR